MIMSLLKFCAALENTSFNFIRISIFVIMAWIGGLKAFPYEADGIVPFVANSPVMSFFFSKPAPEYKSFMNKEGELIEKNRSWHKENNTYIFSYGLGTFIVLIGVLVLAGIYSPKVGAVGDALTIVMSVVTLSFLITTPENWVPNLGDTEYGFPYLSGRGRLVVKDFIMMAAAFASLSNNAKRILKTLDRQVSL
jgi:uncharacterized membrane protein YkgB